jgi:hypothetical protein
MNDIMKTLTIIATIFMPLSFVAGVYGMNFAADASPWNMPELRWPFGYLFALGIMLLTAGGMLTYFWRKGWIGGALREQPPSHAHLTPPHMGNAGPRGQIAPDRRN